MRKRLVELMALAIVVAAMSVAAAEPQEVPRDAAY